MRSRVLQQESRLRPARRAGGLGMLLALLLWHLVSGLTAMGEQRFPPPDFESGHQMPITTTPAARAIALEYLDVAVLAVCLGVASWLIFKKRSRRGLIALSIFSLLYFGFWKEGCVCAIGSVQNVALALFGTGYVLPISVLAFFALPLGVALFAGRAFCSGVCPHGALQDLVLRRPVQLPSWLEHGLGVFPFIYLGAAVLFAATGSAFLICQYDPFVPMFRMSGRVLMVSAGIALLVLGIFVGRPYCRFLCPFGALLKIGGFLSLLRVRVTPVKCTQCRLCEHSCPFGAMRVPAIPDPTSLGRGRRKLLVAILAMPLLLAGFGWIGWRLSHTAARLNPTVSLAERFVRERHAPVKTGVLSPDDLALDRARQNPRELLLSAVRIRRQFEIGSALFGVWTGLVIGVKLISLCRLRRRTDYEPDQGSCVGCARCFEACPDEWIRRGLVPPPAMIEKLPVEHRTLYGGDGATTQPATEGAQPDSQEGAVR